jgi:hypothetical protein
MEWFVPGAGPDERWLPLLPKSDCCRWGRCQPLLCCGFCRQRAQRFGRRLARTAWLLGAPRVWPRHGQGQPSAAFRATPCRQTGCDDLCLADAASTGTVGISSDEQDRECRSRRLGASGGFGTAHAGHGEIGQQDRPSCASGSSAAPPLPACSNRVAELTQGSRGDPCAWAWSSSAKMVALALVFRAPIECAPRRPLAWRSQTLD